ncbi:MAG TPA: CAP domain-containing protein [Solirubrobacteraceae bacterium]|nr:CAP domain-containing protein [Solirubrobacteraceae bacterium]
MALAACALACFGALAFGSSAAEAKRWGCLNAHLHPTAKNAAAINKAILCLVDQIRRARGLPRLHPNGALGSVASSQVVTMVRSDYFADIRPSGQTPLALVGVTSYPDHTEAVAVGQNIAWGTGGLATPAHIVAAWMASPPHRANILSREYRDAGVAMTPAVPNVLRVGHSGATYAFEFGVRRF